ncbi:M15 family metallopeptidase [Turicibacter bilis]|uniref:M15 family metallopeptidase n=1 Tax=Turicibacter bilis TaxID=2735723 RepID=A0A9Q9FFT4_9FIRM|nr:M15 family metallopeptidase [Turicibacter bilis]MBS3197873.1 M15 family metallopeptidase [Turicibacter bilis]UUF08036.1 M15 family metallopeptidase [Turicibacter bilis]
MQKVLVPIGIVALLGSGLLFYSYMMSDEMVLRRLGYDRTLIESLINEQPDLVQDLIEDDRKSEDIVDYLTIKGFNYDCYDAYVKLAEYYPTLESSEVVYLATFLDHVFFPTLLQQGYEEETIKAWFSDPDFNTYVESVDIVALNRLLNYAKETESDLMTLFSYVNYEKQNPYLKLDEVISAIDEYQTVVLPNLKSKGYESQEVEALFYQFGLSDLKSLMETTLNPDQAFELMAASSFDSSSFAIYDEVLSQDENYSVTYALQYAKYPNVKSKFYQDIVETPNTNSLLVLVNQNYRLDEFYAPTDFVPVEVPVTPYSQVNTNYLRRDAADATELLFSKAQEAGYELTLRTGYISYSVQKNLYNQDVYEMGLEYADKFNSRPGHSEHQTGLAIDITTPSINNELSLEFADTEEGKWVLAHAHEYGFIIRYPENRESEVGYFYEPYHLRYVGVEVATEIFENNWTLEDYILNYGLLDAVSDEVQTPEEGTLEQDPSLEDSNEADDADEEESNDHLDESDQEVLPDKSNASQSGSTDSELNEDSSTDDSSSDEDRQQAIQENRELSDQEKYQL